MISKEQIVLLYRRILDRDPESEAVIQEKRPSANSADVAIEMLMSDEFLKKNAAVIKSMVGTEA